MQELQNVKSSMIEAVGYNQEAKQMTVQFKNGNSYVYEGVEAAEFTSILNAESVGKAFNSEIRGKYEGIKS